MRQKNTNYQIIGVFLAHLPIIIKFNEISLKLRNFFYYNYQTNEFTLNFQY